MRSNADIRAEEGLRSVFGFNRYANENIDHWSFWIRDDYPGASACDSLGVYVP